jgi:branched-chain amino acid transport system permease protein
MTVLDSNSSRSIPLLRAAVIAILVALAFLLPQLLGGTSVAYSTLTTIAIFAVMCYGVDIVLSYLGEVSLGHTLFWAVGGYAAANLSVKYGLNGWGTAVATIALCIAAAAFLGAVTLRTREFVFSLVTYAAAVVTYEIAFNWDAIGGSDGIVGISALKLPFGFATYVGATQEDLWPVAFALLLLTLAFIARFRRSSLGTKALMVQMNPALATSLGIDQRKVRLAVFMISAPITGLAGWLYAYQRAYVGPDMFETYFLVMMLTAVALVGRRILLGPLIARAH